LSMTYGFTATWMVAALAYGLVCAALARLARTNDAKESPNDVAAVGAESAS
jgi:hypothetical protein